MSIHEFQKPIQVIVAESSLSNKEAYAIYMESGGMHSNDIWTVVMVEDGTIIHATTKQIRIVSNFTYGINKKR